MDDLKPCPFCGGEGKMGYVRDGLRVHCRLCFASGPSAFHGRPEDASTQARAIVAWNRRADAIEALQAQLAAARDKALEDAAQCCEREADRCDDAAIWGGSRTYVNNCKAAAYAMRDRANAIRALRNAAAAALAVEKKRADDATLTAGDED